MAEYKLRKRALEDMQEIWTYTCARWSEEQADKYWRLIYAALANLARRPRRGRTAESLRAGYLKFSVGSHVIFYVKADDGIDVVRVLHQSMDIDSRFAEDGED